MGIWQLIFFIILFAAEKRLEKKFPRFFKRIELPCAIVVSALVIVYCAALLYGVYDVLTSGVSTGDKVFFTVFIGCIIAVYAAILALMWKDWYKKRESSKSSGHID